MTEFGIVMEPSPGNTARLAAEAEQLGFDILLSPDTQNLSPDPIGQLNLAGAQTKRLRVGTGVTNPITRDPAVLASSMASLSAETGGRALCGIGRGDSSLAHIGKGNGTTAQLKTFVERLRAYLNGEAVERNGRTSQLRWLDSYPVHPVPIDIACTGPKTIQMAVEVGDRISFAVGSAPERLQWAMDTALAHLEKIDRPRDSIQIGAYINLVCDEDEQRALSLGKLIAGMVAHFAGLKNAPTDHLQPSCVRSPRVCSRSTTWRAMLKKREHTSSSLTRRLSTGSRSAAHRTSASSDCSRSSTWVLSMCINWAARQ